MAETIARKLYTWLFNASYECVCVCISERANHFHKIIEINVVCGVEKKLVSFKLLILADHTTDYHIYTILYCIHFFWVLTARRPLIFTWEQNKNISTKWNRTKENKWRWNEFLLLENRKQNTKHLIWHGVKWRIYKAIADTAAMVVMMAAPSSTNV